MKIQRIQTQLTLIQIFLFFILSNMLVSDFRCKWDLSRNSRFQLTQSTKQILANLPDTLYIDAFYSSEIPPEYNARIRLVQEMLKEIVDVSPDTVQLNFYDPDSSEKDKEKAIQSGVEPQTLRRVELGSAQVKSAFLGVTVRIGKDTETIPVVFFAEEAEYQILSTVKKILRKQKHVSSGVAILAEEGSITSPRPGPSSGKDTFGVFIHQIFAPEYGPAFPFQVNSEPLPEDIRILIMAGNPELTELGRYHIDQFLMKGGKLVCLPKTIDFSLEDRPGIWGGSSLGQKGLAQVVQNAKELNDFFAHYGFTVGSDLVLDPSNGMPMGPLVQIEEGLFGRYHYPLWLLLRGEKGNLSEESLFTKDLEVLLFPWASSLHIDPKKQPDAKFQILIQTSPEAFVKEDSVFLGEREVYSLKGEPTGKPIPLGLHIRGDLVSYFSSREVSKKSGTFYRRFSDFSNERGIQDPPEILVLSSPYLISDLLVIRDFREIYQGANAPFFLNALDLLQGDSDLIASRMKKPAFEALENVSRSQEIFYSILNIFFAPFCIGIYAFFRIHARNSAKGGRALWG